MMMMMIAFTLLHVEANTVLERIDTKEKERLVTLKDPRATRNNIE